MFFPHVLGAFPGLLRRGLSGPMIIESGCGKVRLEWLRWGWRLPWLDTQARVTRARQPRLSGRGKESAGLQFAVSELGSGSERRGLP